MVPLSDFPLFNMVLVTEFYLFKLSQQGLSASTLASSFGKVINSKRQLSDYRAEDLATTLLSAVTYNIAQVSQSTDFTLSKQ